MYEYAVNGSLDGFLKDDNRRAILPAATRLSIMYEVARAVHFLHTGGAGFKVFHRDIKSANIYLTEDFTPRLSDCGLAKFVEDEYNAFLSETTIQTGSALAPALGTYGYMCPEYTWNKANHIKCDYIPAFDVYSFGVVMAELILGHLNDGKPTNVLQTYVLNEETPILDGWKRLEEDADGQADWSADALEVVCKTAIGSLIPSSEQRLSTKKLLELLRYAIDLHAGKSDDEPKDAIAKLDAILLNINKRNSESKGAGLDLCIICNRGSVVVKCSEGHGLCAPCIEALFVRDPPFASFNYKLPCPMYRCSSHPFTFRDLAPFISIGVLSYHHILRGDNARILHNASQSGDLKTVSMLLQQNDVDVNAHRDTDGATALLIASEKGHVEVVRLLLGKDGVNVNYPRKTDGATPLCIASQEGNANVVDALLKHSKVDVNAQRDSDGATALHIASQLGRVDIVSELLKHDDADVNVPMDGGATALSIASERGILNVVRLLLEKDGVDVNFPRKTDGATPLCIASELGSLKVVQALLEHSEVDVNAKRDSDGATALVVSSQLGRVDVVSELLKHKNVKLNDPMDGGATALSIASERGILNVVRLLLEKDGVDVNFPRKTDGATPLCIASELGSLKVVQALLEHSEVDVNAQRDSDGATALVVASQQGRVDVVSELLKHKNVKVNDPMDDGVTALFIAVERGTLKVVRLLLKKDGVDVNFPRQTDGATPLYIASQGGNENVVQALLKHSEVDVNAKRDSDGATALHIASQLGCVHVVSELLENDDVEVNVPMNRDVTALFQASQAGHDNVVGLLLEKDGVNVNFPRKPDGATPLYIASKRGRLKVVKKLVEDSKVEVNAVRDSDGATALHIASQEGYEKVVDALLQHRNVQVNLKDKSEKTARDVASGDAVLTVFNNYEDRLRAIEQDRKHLKNVMTAVAGNPVELSYQYIERYITKPKLGSGAFGDVFLAVDSRLPKKFVVKMIKLSERSDGPNDENLKSFHTEFSVCCVFCIVWNNLYKPCPPLPRGLTMMQNSDRHSKDFIMTISLSCTGTI